MQVTTLNEGLFKTSFVLVFCPSSVLVFGCLSLTQVLLPADCNGQADLFKLSLTHFPSVCSSAEQNISRAV